MLLSTLFDDLEAFSLEGQIVVQIVIQSFMSLLQMLKLCETIYITSSQIFTCAMLIRMPGI